MLRCVATGVFTAGFCRWKLQRRRSEIQAPEAVVLSMAPNLLFGVFAQAMTPFQALALVSRSRTIH